MNRRSRIAFGLILSVAFALTLLNAPLASSQGVTLVAAEVTGALPLTDPASTQWQAASAIEVPLSAQVVTRPMLSQTNVKAVTVRALHNGQQAAILVEWADATRNDEMVRVQDFRDAVALQFPLIQGQPFFCMGQLGGNVNIWHWKADWQADLTARQDMNALYPNMYVDQYPFAKATESDQAARTTAADYLDENYLPALAAGNLFASPQRASPVEDLIAGSFGSLTAQPAAGQNVQGYGVWAEGKWRVIFSRALTSAEAEDASFAPGNVYSIAFAAWDGANSERNGQKSTSQWVSLQFAGAGAAPAAPTANRTTPPADMLGVLFVFGPMVLVAGLILGLAGFVSFISALSRNQK